MIGPEALAALVNLHGRITTRAARAGSRRRRLMVSLSHLSEADAASVLAVVPGAKVRHDVAAGTYQVNIQSHAAVVFVEGIVDGLDAVRTSRLTTVLNEVDASHHRASRP